MKSLEQVQILKLLKTNNINSLWHFTDIRNLPLIQKLGGLRSKKFLEDNSLLGKIVTGGDTLSHV